MSDETVIQQLRHRVAQLTEELRAASALVEELTEAERQLQRDLEVARKAIEQEEYLISDLRTQIAYLQSELAAMEKAAGKYRDQVLARAATARALKNYASKQIVGYSDAYPLKDLRIDPFLWALGPIPTDYKAKDWTVTVEGQRVEDWLPFSPLWSDAERPGYRVPHTFFPAWLYKDFNNDPPTPRPVIPSGIADNLLNGTRPIHWGYTPRTCWANFGVRLEKLIRGLVDLCNACDAMTALPHETSTRNQGGFGHPRRRNSC